ncbi:hypothetical protein FGIG_10715 [Fasciola gigantica]|uniref:UBX domain-containing protein n=1 Tax=Fasciola gigantica TaxID=46835 RepID=A0A504Z554_FASGI|nr:hypothetical protein FGIG_10715 [Fasciola gigantica]
MTDSDFDPVWSVFATPRQVSIFGQKPEEIQRSVPEEPQTLGSLLGIDLTPGRGPLSTFLEDLPDEFFEHTEADIRSLIQACRNVWNADEPLKTAAMRNEARLKMYRKYKRAVVQIHWSDGIVVQACFAPGEKLSALFDFVKQLLRQQSMKFSLYTTPPKVTLKQSSISLIEVNDDSTHSSQTGPLSSAYLSAGSP